MAASLASVAAFASFVDLCDGPASRSMTLPVIGLTSARRRRLCPGSMGLRIANLSPRAPELASTQIERPRLSHNMHYGKYFFLENQ